jgi:hypothetical protein
LVDGFRIASAYVDVSIDQPGLDSGIAEVEAKLQAIKDRAVGVNINQPALDADIAKVQAKLQAIKNRAIGVGINQAELDVAVAEIDAMMSAIQNRFNIRVDLEGVATALAEMAVLKDDANDVVTLLGKSQALMAALGAVGFSGSLFSGGIASNWATWAHWIIMGGSELAAVVIPAAIALTATGFEAAQAFQMVEQHMTALWDAAEATGPIFNQTLGTALGLKDALQQAQNAADPEVYALLGAYIGIAKNNSSDLFKNILSSGNTVLQFLDEFAARIRLDLTTPAGANELSGLLAGMITDAVELGQVFGNLGHAILNFAADMPGAAELILRLVDYISEFILRISELPSWIITAVVAFEEMYRWGGLVATIFSRLMQAVSTIGTLGIPLLIRFGEILVSFASSAILGLAGLLVNLGATIEALTIFGDAGVAAGEAIGGLGVALADFVESVPDWEILVGVLFVAAFVALSIAALHSQTAMEQWAGSLNKTIASASNLDVVSQIVNGLAQATTKQMQAQDALNAATEAGSTVTAGVSSRYEGEGVAVQSLTANVAAAASEHNYLNQTMQNVIDGAGLLEKMYGTTYVGALALAQLANVKLASGITGTGTSADLARLQISDYVDGLQAMGQPLGVVGNDMTALAIQSGLSASKVSQLNQAYDQFVQNVVGGTSALGGLVNSISNIGVVTQSSFGDLGETQQSFSLTTTQAAQAMESFGDTGSQVWQNFDTTLSGSAEQLMDWFRTAGAEGEMTSTQFVSATKDMIAQLLPFAQNSSAAVSELSALAQQAGGPSTSSLQTLTQWVGNTHNASTALSSIIQTVTQNMGNMASVAQNLGDVMESDVIDMMDSTKLKLSGVQSAITAYTNALSANGTVSDTTREKYANLVQILTQVTGNNTEANTIAQTYSRSLGDDSESAITAKTNVNEYSTALGNIPKSEQTELKLAGSGNWSVSQLGWALTTPAGSYNPYASPPGLAKGGKFPGFGGGDVIPFMGEPGEAIIPKELVPEISVWAKRRGIPGFSSGGVLQSYSGDIGGLAGFGMGALSGTGVSAAGAVAAAIWKALEALSGGNLAANGAANEAIGRSLATSYGWSAGAQWQALANLWTRESGWNNTAQNASSGAYGIPQALPYSKMPKSAWPASAGGQSDPSSQIGWGLGYIRDRYGSPLSAWAHELSAGWYDQGGVLPPGLTLAMNATGQNEQVIAPGSGGAKVVQNFYASQLPTASQRSMMARDLTLALGTAP